MPVGEASAARAMLGACAVGRMLASLIRDGALTGSTQLSAAA